MIFRLFLFILWIKFIILVMWEKDLGVFLITIVYITKGYPQPRKQENSTSL